MEKFDLVVIGGGPSGYAAAMRALDYGKKTLLLEKSQLGGAGVTNGALSSKTWWQLASEAAILRENANRFDLDNPEMNFFELKTEVERAVHERISLLRNHIDVVNECDKYCELLSYRNGTAKLKSQNEIHIQAEDKDYTVWAENIVLATGSRPRKLPEIPIDEKIILTSDGIGAMESFPKSMVILGAGVIGCEFATIFSGFGETKVHLIDKGDRILPFEDEDVVKVIERNLEKNGVLIHRNSRLTKMEIVDGWVKYNLEYTDGKQETFFVEKALISVGRIPNFEGLGLEELGVEMDARGIKDSDTQTSVDNIYAVGDITADIALVNVGELEARHAVEKMFANPAKELVYENISTIMFLRPVVAGVGLNEIQAQKKGIPYKVASLDYRCIPRAVAMRDTQGFIKLLVTNDDEMKILGMRVVGNQASSAIQAVALLISMNKGIEELAECVHPHPAIIEGIQEVVRMLLGKSMFKPLALTQHMSCRVWDGEYSDYAATPGKIHG